MFLFCSHQGGACKRKGKKRVTTKAPSKNQIENALSKDERMRALVRFLARRAAENDYKELLNVLNSKPEHGIIPPEREEQ